MAEMTEIHAVFFAVNDCPVCVWDADPAARNAEFLGTIQPEYFSYLADLFGSELRGPNKQFASMTLGAAYSQALETLFAFLFAALQAPHCVVGWMTRYRQDDLINLVSAVGCRQIRTFIPLPSQSWAGIVEAFHRRPHLADEAIEPDAKKQVVRLWSRLAADFTDQVRSDQYNSIKHGFRGQPGGFRLHVGTPKPDGNPPDDCEYVSLGGSDFGSLFFVLKSLNHKYQYSLRRAGRNWQPETLVARLRFIALSLRRILAFLREFNGMGAVDFAWPPPDEFESALRCDTGVISMTLPSVTIADGDLEHITKDQILAVYERSAWPPSNSPRGG